MSHYEISKIEKSQSNTNTWKNIRLSTHPQKYSSIQKYIRLSLSLGYHSLVIILKNR